MKRTSKYLFAFILIGILSVLAPIKPAKAFGPAVAVCSNDLAAWWPLTDDVKQLFEIREDNLLVDAAGAHMMSFNGSNDTVAARIIKRDGPTLATATGTVGTNPSWVYFDFTNTPMPRGVYYLALSTTTHDGAAVHYTNTPDCITDSYMQVNDSSNFDHDMGFAVYALSEDSSSTSGTSQNPTSSDPIGNNDSSASSNNGSSQSANSSNSTGSNSTSTGSNKNTSSNYPTTQQILDMTKNDQDIGLTGMQRFVMYGIPILIVVGVIFLLIVAFLIFWLVMRSKKSNSGSPTSSPPSKK